MENEKKRIKILIVEDEPGLQKEIKEILEPYKAEIEVLSAHNAGEAIPLLFPNSPQEKPDALILDIMLPYGNAAEILYSDTDPKNIKTGLRLLKKLRKREKENPDKNVPLLWTAVITARSNPRLIQELNNLLEDRGRIYSKPYSDVVLEHDLAIVLGIESKAPQVLLPQEYRPPVYMKGGEK